MRKKYESSPIKDVCSKQYGENPRTHTKAVYVICSLVVALVMTALALPGYVVTASALEGEALALSRSSVVSDDTDISRNVIIELDFNKNVCDLQVLKSNAESVHLLDKDNNPVAVKITFPDTQVQTSYKRQIFVTPKETLRANEDYTLVIENSLASKDGEKLNKTYLLKFRTGESDKREENTVLSLLRDDIMEFESNSPVNPELLTSNEKKTEAKAVEKKNTVPVKTILIILIVAVIGVVSVILLRPKKSPDDK